MKKIVKINKRENIELYSTICDGYIIGLKDFSVDFDDTFSCDEIFKLKNKYDDKEIFVSVNKNIFNEDLENLEKILVDLNDSNIKLLFYDLSILYLKNKNKLNNPLVWNQTHMVTNYNTCNYYYDKGCEYGFISGEVTLDEVVEIKQNTKMSLLVQIVGHQTMAHSRRSLLTNYYESINKKYDGNIKEISNMDKKYLITENKFGTIIKTSDILNGIVVLPKLIEYDIDYVVIDESYIDKETILKSLKCINNIICGKEIGKNINDSYKLLGKNTSFFYNKTIYKVKRED